MKKNIKMYSTLMECMMILSIAVAFCLPTSACAADPSPDLKTLQKEIQRLSDIAEVQKVMSKHAFYYSAGQHERELEELWAMDQPDVSFGSMDNGYMVGAKSIHHWYVEYFNYTRERDLKGLSEKNPQVKNIKENWGAGTSMFHSITTPIIEVAGDGKTAKGIFYSPGYVTQVWQGNQTAQWMWERYAVDFLKVDGQWKIWHFHVFADGTLPGGMGNKGGEAPQDQSPPPEQQKPAEGGKQYPPGTDENTPGFDVPIISTVKSNLPRGFEVPQEKPRVPQPYNTFGETFSYGPPEK